MDAKKIDAKEVVSASKKLSRKDAVVLIKAAKKSSSPRARKSKFFPAGRRPRKSWMRS